MSRINKNTIFAQHKSSKSSEIYRTGSALPQNRPALSGRERKRKKQKGIGL
jgi:hypothetical protein